MEFIKLKRGHNNVSKNINLAFGEVPNNVRLIDGTYTLVSATCKDEVMLAVLCGVVIDGTIDHNNLIKASLDLFACKFITTGAYRYTEFAYYVPEKRLYLAWGDIVPEITVYTRFNWMLNSKKDMFELTRRF